MMRLKILCTNSIFTKVIYNGISLEMNFQTIQMVSVLRDN